MKEGCDSNTRIIYNILTALPKIKEIITEKKKRKNDVLTTP